MFRKTSSMVFLLLLSLLVAVPAFADQPAHVGGGLGNKAPNFSAGVFADGQAWGTKGTTSLPAPNANNAQSYDPIIVFSDPIAGQLPVGEAAPGNPNYNGGRWMAYQATWAEGASPVVLRSYGEVMAQVVLGNITLVNAHNYFQCPLLPVK